MYDGRDMTELSMMSKTDWEESELNFYHHSFQQILPYLNAEGQSIYREVPRRNIQPKKIVNICQAPQMQMSFCGGLYSRPSFFKSF